MLNEPDKNYVGWIRKAEEDELSARVILEQGGAPSTACFLAQQLAEKCLKGLLVSFGKTFPKVHDLLELETLALDVVPGIKEVHEDLEFLNRYYIETRYPGDYPQFSVDECKKAYKAALRVKDFALNNLKN